MEAELTDVIADPLLRRIPGEWPQAFHRLSVEERAWRGRAFLVVYVLTGSLPFAWAYALDDDPDHVAECRAVVATIPDAAIRDGLDSLRTGEGR